MVREYLGDTIDIHGGGTDLIFPHHENEIAQSEAATGKPLSKIWMHNEMVNVVSGDNSAQKMAKSAGNFFTVRNAAEAYGYEPIRFMLIAAHYRSKLTYSVEVIKSAQASLERLYNCESAMKRLLETKNGDYVNEKILTLINTHKTRFIEAMDDDLNTADALAVVFELTREINKALSDENTTKADITALYALFKELTGVLGLLYREVGEIPMQIHELVQKRAEARKNKDFALADRIRDEITAKGYMIEETRQGTVIKKA
jgi:cysteinyl-tRNA synthetase